MRRAAALLIVSVGAAPAARAQLAVGGQVVAAWTGADRTPFGDARGEFKVVQPVIMAHVARGPLRVAATINLESVTMRHGELMPGIFGEGFNDRRHPHTTVHELMTSVVVRVVSLSAGKGFAPYGTDDPMSRPALRFPINHHWSQILERAVVIGAVRAGPLVLEGGLFNGDEPERPGQWPAWDRFGDSWSARLTLRPRAGLELQASTADVASPEHRPGFGPSQRKYSASARVEGRLAGARAYAMAEWARSEELDGLFTFGTALAEGQLAGRHVRGWLRLERSERPEEQRVFTDPFRSVRPHHDNSILGITRWTTVTVGAARGWTGPRGSRVEPLAEVTFARVSNVTGVVQTPDALFGGRTIWSASVGVRLAAGPPMRRMGRYGVLADRQARH